MTRRPYIPKGCDQQGRVKDGKFLSCDESTPEMPHGDPALGLLMTVLAWLAVLCLLAAVGTAIRAA